jgi:hypothetical protein
MTVREVERWLRDRKAKSVIKDITKFRECGYVKTCFNLSYIYIIVKNVKGQPENHLSVSALGSVLTGR